MKLTEKQWQQIKSKAERMTITLQQESEKSESEKSYFQLHVDYLHIAQFLSLWIYEIENPYTEEFLAETERIGRKLFGGNT